MDSSASAFTPPLWGRGHSGSSSSACGSALLFCFLMIWGNRDMPLRRLLEAKYHDRGHLRDAFPDTRNVVQQLASDPPCVDRAHAASMATGPAVDKGSHPSPSVASLTPDTSRH